MRRGTFYTVLAVLGAVAGYISNDFSKLPCLQNAASWYCGVLMMSDHFYLQPGPDPDAHRIALEMAGAVFTPLPADAGPDTFPRVTMSSAAIIPWVISVRFERERGDGERDAFTAHYLGVFGLAVSVGDSFELPTS
jgi:hypothetical protein